MTPLQLNRYKNKNSPLTHRVRGILFCLLPSSVCGRTERPRSARPQTGKRERRGTEEKEQRRCKDQIGTADTLPAEKTFFIRRGIFYQENKSGGSVSDPPPLFPFRKTVTPQFFYGKNKCRQSPLRITRSQKACRNVSRRRSRARPASANNRQ